MKAVREKAAQPFRKKPLEAVGQPENHELQPTLLRFWIEIHEKMSFPTIDIILALYRRRLRQGRSGHDTAPEPLRLKTMTRAYFSALQPLWEAT